MSKPNNTKRSIRNFKNVTSNSKSGINHVKTSNPQKVMKTLEEDNQVIPSEVYKPVSSLTPKKGNELAKLFSNLSPKYIEFKTPSSKIIVRNGTETEVRSMRYRSGRSMESIYESKFKNDKFYISRKEYLKETVNSPVSSKKSNRLTFNRTFPLINGADELSHYEVTDLEKIIPFNAIENLKKIKEQKNKFSVSKKREEQILQKDDNASDHRSSTESIEKNHDIMKNKSLLTNATVFDLEESNMETPRLRTVSNEKSIATNNPPTELQAEMFNKKDEDSECEASVIVAKSPSVESVDSANGSSLVNEQPLYKEGDLFWGQIYAYCNWPCIVCPDPEGRIIQLPEEGERKYNRNIRVHVLFFADNGRRNWVKCSNLLPYKGFENYMEYTTEIRTLYSKKDKRQKCLFPSLSLRDAWHEAIKEANVIFNLEYSERLKKFYEFFDEMNKLKIKKKNENRRRSMALESTSDLGSLYDSTDNIFLNHSKRNRSPSPFSPAYSPIGESSKRRRLDSIQIDLSDELTRDDYSQITKDNEVFKHFITMFNKYILDENNDVKLKEQLHHSVNVIWKVVEITDSEVNFNPLEENSHINYTDNGIRKNRRNEVEIKILAKRLKNIKLNFNFYKNYAGSENEEKFEMQSEGEANSRENANNENKTFTPVTLSLLQSVGIFKSNEFKEFNAIVKNFVFKYNRNEQLERYLHRAICNTWALVYLSRKQLHDRLIENYNRNEFGLSSLNEGSKRKSNRIQNLIVRRSLESTMPNINQKTTVPVQKLNAATELKKTNKISTTPIEELINDIFSLDRKYLFKGLGREPVCKYCVQSGGNIIKCSNNCQTWLHVDCIAKSQNDTPSTQKHSLAKTSTTSASLITTDGNTSPLESNVTKVVSNTKMHITGDMSESDNSTESEYKTVENAIVCKECANNEKPECSVCCSNDETVEKLMNCNMQHCSKGFHPTCCRYWPQAKIIKSKNSIESFRCPSHVCHTCVSDDPKGKFQNISRFKLTSCVKCPATYHTDSTCIPAGSQILSSAHIICPRHNNNAGKSDKLLNVNWCFICVKGGDVVCCETCPISVHAQCLNIPIDSNEMYICEECESGRMPLYGEIVWAKFKMYRWWPAIILPPTEVPMNLQNKRSNPFEFVVRFFGSHDHGWISRRRVYLYVEGDFSEPPKAKTGLIKSYNRGVGEAKRIYEMIKLKKQTLSNENKKKLHPQPYIKIKTNRAVPPLKLHPDLEKVSKCECKASSENPCGPDSNCLNRVLYHECNRKLCPAGERCQNQMFESRLSPRLDVVYMNERGFGLICKEEISAGTFVIEYVGEVINDDEFKQRMAQKSIERDENFYFLSVEKDYIIDAGPKGNLARFMNHSCDPNCETQKWTVNGLMRVGLFTIKDVPADTELTFNYHWNELLGSNTKICSCGVPNCTGQIGKTPKVEKTKDKGDTQNEINRKTKNTAVKKRKKNVKNKKKNHRTLKNNQEDDSQDANKKSLSEISRNNSNRE